MRHSVLSLSLSLSLSFLRARACKGETETEKEREQGTEGKGRRETRDEQETERRGMSKRHSQTHAHEQETLSEASHLADRRVPLFFVGPPHQELQRLLDRGPVHAHLLGSCWPIKEVDARCPKEDERERQERRRRYRRARAGLGSGSMMREQVTYAEGGCLEADGAVLACLKQRLLSPPRRIVQQVWGNMESVSPVAACQSPHSSLRAPQLYSSIR